MANDTKIQLVSGSLPKSTAGRKPVPINSDLYDALLQMLTSSPLADDGRPATYGPPSTFTTKGQATADGQRYSKPLAEKLGKTVRVNVYGDAGAFSWRVYVPLSAAEPTAATATE